MDNEAGLVCECAADLDADGGCNARAVVGAVSKGQLGAGRGITMREYVAKPDDVPGMRDCLSHCWCNSVKLVQGLAADFPTPAQQRLGFWRLSDIVRD